MDQVTMMSAANQKSVPAKKGRTPNTASEEIDLVEIFYLLVSRWKLLFISALIGAVIMGMYHTYFIKPAYQAYTEMYVTSSDSVISLTDLQLSSALTEDYRAIITSRAVLNEVIEKLQLNTDYKGLRRMISVSNANGTHIIHTAVTTSNLELSRDIANELLVVSIDRIYQVIGSGEPMVIDYSEAEAVEDITPGIIRYMGMGALAAMIVVACLLIIKNMLDVTIKNDDDVEKYLQMPVLAAVPFYKE